MDIFHGSAIFIMGFFNTIKSGLFRHRFNSSGFIQPCLLSQRGRGKVITWSYKATPCPLPLGSKDIAK